MSSEEDGASTTQPDDWLSPADEFIGREEELSRFTTILERDEPALILLIGEIGVGKSTLLQQVRARLIAQQSGWIVIPPDTTDEMAIEPKTNDDLFSSRLMDLLELPVDKIASESATKSSASALVEQICARVPLLLIIDGYRPSETFADWFIGSFLFDIKKTAAAIFIVVSSERDHVDMLVPLANEIIQLEPLDRNVIQQRLENIGRRISPPMEPAELEVYVEAVRDKPNLLRSLISVLSLAQTASDSV